jgi:hypothetical protein
MSIKEFIGKVEPEKVCSTNDVFTPICRNAAKAQCPDPFSESVREDTFNAYATLFPYKKGKKKNRSLAIK